MTGWIFFELQTEQVLPLISSPLLAYKHVEHKSDFIHGISYFSCIETRICRVAALLRRMQIRTCRFQSEFLVFFIPNL